ncbi:RluA family pseudouridine synthase [Arenicella chitinivorans]|uniref:RluA family pseudouridine synthase n=1 Tax=Arenicella chitinivorans TaxID=1329800 RepID=UPI0016729C38|nr:RluA family pseudouridine synthase [Arenicella chitinivorans]
MSPTPPTLKQHHQVSFVTIDDVHAGQRVDNFLFTHLKGVPKTHIYRIIRKGEVRVNKGRVKQTTKLKVGDQVRIPPIRLAERTAANIDATRYEFLKRATLFEDDALLIINKPSGMAVHAGSGIQIGLIEALRAVRQDLRYLELVHRLDRATSGCLVLAKKASVLKALHEDFKNNSLTTGRLDKRYYTLVKGRWRHGERNVVKPLNTEARQHGERVVIVDAQGKYARSIMRPVSVSDLASLVEVKLLTGRTHQVRVHALSEGHPIAGDPKYGDLEFNKSMKAFGLSRLFLHAVSLRFRHPITDAELQVEAPLSDDLNAVLTQLTLSLN